jgi:hypothetical protein
MQVAGYPACDGARVQQPCSNPGEQGQTRTIAFWREYAYLQEYPNTRERLRCCESAFARRKSGVRIPSAPPIKWLKKALVGDPQHQDGDVVTGGLLLKVQSGALYTAGNGRSVERN